jgi:hypothetical protein
MKEERRLVWRVLRRWKEIAPRGRFARRDDIESWIQVEDGANCLLIAVESPIELSHFVSVGENLAIALCPTDTLAGVLLSRLPQVVSARRGLMIEGGATLRGMGITYRSVLLPLSERGVVIDHVLSATNYRLLRADEVRATEVISPIHWLQPAHSLADCSRPAAGFRARVDHLPGAGGERAKTPIIELGQKPKLISDR